MQEQKHEMESSFSELHVTKELIKDLQKEMLEKDLALDNANQRLRSTEEVLEQMQMKFVEEKERLQNELNTKEKLLEDSRTQFFDEINKEKTLATEYFEKIENLTVEIQNYQKQLGDFKQELKQKDYTIDDLGQRLDGSKQRHRKEMESLKLELEYVKEGESDSAEQIKEISEKYEEQLKQLQNELKESEDRILELNSVVKQRDALIVSAENKQTATVQRVRDLEEEICCVRPKHDEEILEFKNLLEKQQELVVEKEDALRDMQNEIDSLKSNHKEEMAELRRDLDQFKSSSHAQQPCLADETAQVRKQHEMELDSLEEKVLGEQLLLGQEDKEDFASLKEKLRHQEEEYDKIRKLYDSLGLEKENLLAEQVGTKRELDKYLALQSNHERDVDQLHQRIQALEDDLARLQDSDEGLLIEETDFVNLDEQGEEGNEEKLIIYRKTLQEAGQEHARQLQLVRDELQESELKKGTAQAEKDEAIKLLEATEEKVHLLENIIKEMREGQDSIVNEKQQALERLRKTEVKISEIEKENEEKVHQLESKMQELLQHHEVAAAKQQESENLLEILDKERGKQTERYENEMEELNCQLQDSQNIKDKYLAEQQKTADLLRNAEELLVHRTEAYENEIRKLHEKLQEFQDDKSTIERVQTAKEQYLERSIECENENKVLKDQVQELKDSRSKFLGESEELRNILNKTQTELLQKQKEHDIEIRQMDEQLEQTRQVIESIRSDNDSELINLKESFDRAEEEFQRKLQEKENKYQDLLQSMQSDYESVKGELEMSIKRNEDFENELKSLVSGKGMLIQRGEEKDCNSNRFEEQPLIHEIVTSSDNWMDVQGETGTCYVFFTYCVINSKLTMSTINLFSYFSLSGGGCRTFSLGCQNYRVEGD